MSNDMELVFNSQGGLEGIIFNLEYYYNEFAGCVIRRDTNSQRSATLQELIQLRDGYEAGYARDFLNQLIDAFPTLGYVQPTTGVPNQGDLSSNIIDPGFLYSQQGDLSFNVIDPNLLYSQQGPGFAPSAEPQMLWPAAPTNQEVQPQHLHDNFDQSFTHPGPGPSVEPSAEPQMLWPAPVNQVSGPGIPLPPSLPASPTHFTREPSPELNDAADEDLFGPEVSPPTSLSASPSHSAREPSPNPGNATARGLVGSQIALPTFSSAPPAQPARETSPEPNNAADAGQFGPDIPLPPFPSASPAHSARKPSPEPKDAEDADLFGPIIPLRPFLPVPPAQPAPAEPSPEPKPAVLGPQNQKNRVRKTVRKGNAICNGCREDGGRCTTTNNSRTCEACEAKGIECVSDRGSCKPGSCQDCRRLKVRCESTEGQESCNSCLKLGKTCNRDVIDKRTNNSMKGQYRKAYDECKKYHSDLVLLCNQLVNRRQKLSQRAVRELIEESNPKLWFAVCFGPDIDPKTCEQVRAYRAQVGLDPDSFPSAIKLDKVRATFPKLIEANEKEIDSLGFYLTLLTSDHSFDWAVAFWKHYMQGKSHEFIKQEFQKRGISSIDEFNLIPSLTARVKEMVHKYYTPRLHPPPAIS